MLLLNASRSRKTARCSGESRSVRGARLGDPEPNHHRDPEALRRRDLHARLEHAMQPKKRLLGKVLGLADAAEQTVGDPE